MADVPNTVMTMNSNFKVVYGKLQDALPDFAILQKRIEYGDADKNQLGKYFEVPIILAQEAGFTYCGEAGDVATLNDAVAGAMKSAQVQGSELILKTQLSYKLLSATQSDVGSFKRATKAKVLDMNNAMRKRLEIAMLYGRSGIGTVAGAISGQVMTLTDASWAGGIWSGLEGAYIDVYQSDLSTLRQGNLKVSAVDHDAKTVTVVGTATGITTNDVIFFKGANNAGTFNEMNGLHKILTATSTIFNIDPSAYSLWKGNVSSSFGEASFPSLQRAIIKAVNKGLMGPVLSLLSPRAWAVLADNMAALRAIGGEYSPKKGENGFESLVFHSSNGKIEIVSHPFVKEGDIFNVPEQYVQRVGSSDVTFQIPGRPDEFFTQIPGKSGVEMQCYTDQAIFLERPAHGVYCSGVTYTP